MNDLIVVRRRNIDVLVRMKTPYVKDFWRQYISDAGIAYQRFANLAGGRLAPQSIDCRQIEDALGLDRGWLDKPREAELLEEHELEIVRLLRDLRDGDDSHNAWVKLLKALTRVEPDIHDESGVAA